MNTGTQLSEINIRTVLRPGDMGQVIHLHGTMYQQEYGYGLAFESYVAQGMHEFQQQFNPHLDAVWVAEHQHEMVGFMLLMHRLENAAQLRFFIIKPAFRGLGLGKLMMEQFMQALHQNTYQTAYLWTTDELPAAASLYLRHGFKLTAEKPSTAFGKALKEQRYDLDLSKSGAN